MVPPAGTPLRAHRLRPLNTPRPVAVELSPRGVPVAVTAFNASNDASVTPPTPGASPGLVETVGEMWRVDDEWWRQPLQRRYYEVVMKGGKHTVLYQDLVTGEWFEQTP